MQTRGGSSLNRRGFAHTRRMLSHQGFGCRWEFAHTTRQVEFPCSTPNKHIYCTAVGIHVHVEEGEIERQGKVRTCVGV